jgi:thiol:disulfide interchange protein DsbD
VHASMPRLRRHASLGLVVLLVCGAGALHAQRGPARAGLTLLLSSDGARQGAPIRVALQVRLPEGYHVNSNHPRDPSLIPVRLDIEPPAGVTVDEIVFPAPTDLRQRDIDQTLSVFEHKFVIGVSLRLAPDAPKGDLAVAGRLRYQACDEVACYIPATAPFEWTLPVVSAQTPVKAQHADVFKQIAFGHGERPAAAVAPTPAPVARVPEARAAPRDVAATLDEFSVAGMTSGYLGSSAFLEFIHDAERGVVHGGWFEGRGPVAILLIVLLGGLALNLTPCVLPMIPINLAIVGAGAQASSRTRGLLLGATYGAAMAVAYGILGLVVVLTAGTFGTLNASPWFNLGIAVLFVVLALAMFDVILIDFSSLGSKIRVGEAGRGSFLVAFGMGGVAALLAGACVAPVVVQVMVFSSQLYASGTPSALALPFVLGLGMAAPWPLAGAGIAALPRPGAWMVRVKQAFGALILITAAYYGYETYSIFANRFVDASEVSSSVEAKLKEGWHASLADGLAVAQREHKPILIDMWATWCKNCLVMDGTTLQDDRVKQALGGYVKIKFQAENPDEPATKQIMQRFNAIGLPTYVILKPAK